MSAVYFHSPERTAALRGSERAYLSHLVKQTALGLLNPGWNQSELAQALPRDHYILRTPMSAAEFAQQFRTATVMDLTLNVGGRDVEWFTTELNTAIAVGNDQMILAARIHAQSEIHAWVDGPNRVWLAGIIEEGRESDLYREGAGWEGVAELLRERDDEPVVMSFSVTDQFPNVYVSDRMPEWPQGVPERWDELTEDQQKERERIADEWYDLPPAEQWASCMPNLRASEGGLELRPDAWSDFRFSGGDTAMSVLAELRKPQPVMA
jgi:hypothetical protein